MKAFKCLILIVFAFFFSAPGRLGAENALLDSAHVAYEAGDYATALNQYEQAYAGGMYSEKSLYRLAFIHEQMREYPEAIYYLKKIAAQYGGRHIQEKVVQLMQKNGNANFFTDENTEYIRLLNRFAWIFWILFMLGVLLLSAWFIRFRFQQRAASLRYVISGTGILTGLSGFALVLQLFVFSNRAVLISPTAFYSGPGYGSVRNTQTFSTGETVVISRRKDIWCRIHAGNKEAWVPGFVLRSL